MAFYDRPPPNEDRGGCLDVWIITRAVFGVLFWPLAVLALIIIDLAVITWLFTTNAPLALIPIAVTVVAVIGFARWEQKRYRPPGL